MNKNEINYDSIVEDALKLVVKKSLEIINDKGLPGDHHFYISFDASHKEIKVPLELRTNKENEIKIILQHQFWNLQIDDKKFSVTLSFNGQKKDITVPFDAIISFADPSVGFVLHFKNETAKKMDLTEHTLKINTFENKDIKTKPEAEILSLDAFRTKKED